MTEKQRKILTAAALAVFVLFCIAVAWFVGLPMLRFVEEPERFRAWVDAGGAWSRLAFVGMMLLQVIVAIIPGEPFEIGAGYAFGAVEGTILCLAATTIGGMLIFLFVRRWGVKAVEVFFPREKIESLRFLKDTRRLTLLAFILFFLPGTPKDLLTYFVGLTKMPLGTWLLITSVARLPSIVTSTVGGDALGLGDITFAVIVFAATLFLSAAGALIYRSIAHRRERRTE